MKILKPQSWEISPEQAVRIQIELAKKVIKEGNPEKVNLVAGVDVSSPDNRGIARGAVVLLSHPELRIVEVKVKEGRVFFPYIPGLLAFRELPLLLEIWGEIEPAPDLVLVDGQGIAHPRRLGIASHLGVLLNLSTIGCAKSRLIGKHEPVPDKLGGFSFLMETIERIETIGAVLRTEQGSPPIYVSVGHKISLEAAIQWVLKLCRGHRLPEPIRLAHLAASGRLRLPLL